MSPPKTLKEKYLYNPNNYIVAVIFILSITSFFFLDISSLRNQSNAGDNDIFEAKVLEVISERDPTKQDITFVTTLKVQELLVEVPDGESTKRINITNDFSPVKTGNKIYVRASLFGEAGESHEIVSIGRNRDLLLLAVFFGLLVLITTGIKGIKALVGLVFSFSVIFTYIVPQILSGANPVTVSLIGSSVILIGTLYVTYGFNRKSTSALIGISITLLFVGLLANFLVHGMNFTGASTEEATFLTFAAKNTISLIGLLIAGIIIAAIGVLDDIAITQASVVAELVSTDPSLSKAQLFKKAMVLGKDHISAVINTLILAYTGASLPLVLLFFLGDYPMGYLVSNELIAEEIVRTLAASSGLVLAVPITTLVAVTLFKGNGVALNESRDSLRSDGGHIGHHHG
ncbi:MAG: YibE/F family protein [Candidatus Vogelbacteria bacterium]|nr:YibE/F family protein [Candidatus Vogelbacteria bacterium]